MFRRDFIKHTALIAASAAVYSPLSAANIDNSVNQKIIAVVSESANETGYVASLKEADRAERVIVLGCDKLSNFNALSSAIKNNNGSIFCGLLTPSDHALLSQAAMLNGVSLIAETEHTPSARGVTHTEKSFTAVSVKQAFEQFAKIGIDKYGKALSSYHTIVTHNAASNEKQITFTTGHSVKNAFVSFVLKA